MARRLKKQSDSTVKAQFRSSVGRHRSVKHAKRTDAEEGTGLADGLPDFDVRTEIFREPTASDVERIAEELFDEAGYLRLNPDVRRALEAGQVESGYSHYLMHGLAEGRPLPDVPREARNVLLTSIAAPSDAAVLPTRGSIDALLIAKGAGLMIVGWIDDFIHPINCIRIIAPDWRVVMDSSRLIRLRRTDVEAALGSRAQHSYGFLGFVHFERGGQVSASLRIELWQQGGFSTSLQCSPTLVEGMELRNTALAHLAGATFFGNAVVESITGLADGLGEELIRFNCALTRQIVASPYIERFGPQIERPRGTIIVCLYGKPEYYFVQNCLFSGLPGIDDYEFVYVSNSPEIAEILLREAQSASLIYGMANTVMILSGNSGFGAANNAAARIARSDRLLIVNPDVFPRDHDWALKHSQLLDAAPRERTMLFGVPLYYDDGSLMHAGMFFDIDTGLSLTSGVPVSQRMCRVEHYGKGSPAQSLQFAYSRPVPAVSGAFISIDRPWYEHLGGFTEDFIFGHYEDADLCLKSIGKGVAPWLQDIRMWHLEGKGSTRMLQHEGGSLVNRWLFSKMWAATIEAGLTGPNPDHLLMRTATDAIRSPSGILPSKSNLKRQRRAST